mgnify:CR=1 FL=1
MLRLKKLPTSLSALKAKKPVKRVKRPKSKKKTTIASKPLEKDIQKSIIQYLQFAGCAVVRVNSGAVAIKGKRSRFIKFNDSPGCSDLLCCIEGRFVAIEVKRPASRTEAKHLAEQQAFQERIRKSGGYGYFVTSVKEVVDIVEKIRSKNNG